MTNYVRSPKMNGYVEKGIDTIQIEYGDKIEDAKDVEELNEILYEFMIYYNFYRTHQSLQYQTTIDYYNKL